MTDYPMKIFWSLLVSAVLVMVVGMLNGENSYSRYLDLKASRFVMKKTIADIHAENEEMKEEIIKLKKSKSYARKVLRDRYHVLEEDENIIFFAD